MDNQEKAKLSEIILEVIRSLQFDEETWVDFARIGAPLAAKGIQYKQFNFPKLRPFLNEFQNVLEFKDEQAGDKPPVCYVRPLGKAESKNTKPYKAVPSTREATVSHGSERVPSEESRLFQWASIPFEKIKQLSESALEERWYYGESPSPDQDALPILKNYLAYTFKRLCFEKKVLIREDTVVKNGEVYKEEYAAFNTGLVDKKYEYIYALFKQNTLFPTPYWYLLDFVVAGEDIGKTIVKLFNPLPERANYFENKIQNMLYDTSTGPLSCDYKHIITERTYRLPAEFLKENCPPDFLCVDGVSIDDVCGRPDKDEAKKKYFDSLGQKIEGDTRILNRLKNRIEDAVKLALKKVEWNYKTAIPMYYPAKHTGSLLLPLCLVNEDHVDLALVVERQTSGAYQGQTILPLELAYSNSRLVTRPDSDWLKTNLIDTNSSEEFDDNR